MTTSRARLAVAGLLIAFAVFVFAVVEFFVLTDDANWLWDFGSYYVAVERMLESDALYLPLQLDGPFHAICEDCYLYPPPFAQLLVPVTAIPLGLAKAIWFVVMLTAAWLSVWLALDIGGAPRTRERAAWSLVAVAYFGPTIHAVWNGNVGTILGLLVVLVALGGTVAGVSAALATLLKVSPGPLLFVALAAGRRSAVATLVTLATVVAVSFVLSPDEWLEYPTVLLNMMLGEGDHHANLALAEVAARSGVPDLGVGAVSLVALIGGVAATLGAIWTARRPDGLPMAVLLATVAMLIVPGTLWYHYLAVVAPLAAMAWPRTVRWERFTLVGAAVVTTIAQTPILPYELALPATAVMLALAGRALWPGARATAAASVSPADGHA